MSEGASHILITFCNTPGWAPALALYDVETGGISVLRTPPELAARKAAGVAVGERHLYVISSRTEVDRTSSVEPPNPSTLFIFNRSDLSLLAMHVCALVYDGHSMVVHNQGLDVVSTGSDEIVRLTIRGSTVEAEDVIWRADPNGKRADIHHINALGTWRGHRIASGFGRKSAIPWSSAASGFIVSTTTGERLVDGIRQPHSLLDVDGALIYCESARKAIHIFGTGKTQTLPGYTRGLARVGNSLFAATSRGRRVSKSSGLLTNRADPGTSDGRCTLTRLDAHTLEIQGIVELDSFGAEVYDLVPVTGVSGWPVLTELEWRDGYIAGLSAGYEERDATIAWLHTEVAARDDTIQWLHWEVAERDRKIVWLHREVADRDRRLAGLAASNEEQLTGD